MNKTPEITLTISGLPGVGKSTLAYQIHKFLLGYGLKVNHIENELNELGVDIRKAGKLIKEIRDKGTIINIIDGKKGIDKV